MCLVFLINIRMKSHFEKDIRVLILRLWLGGYWNGHEIHGCRGRHYKVRYREVTWVNICWICATGLSEPLPMKVYSPFCPSYLNLNKQYLLLGWLTHLPVLRCRTLRMQYHRIHLLTWVTMRLKLKLSTNNILPQRQNFLQIILQKPCFVTSLDFDITIYCFVAK